GGPAGETDLPVDAIGRAVARTWLVDARREALLPAREPVVVAFTTTVDHLDAVAADERVDGNRTPAGSRIERERARRRRRPFAVAPAVRRRRGHIAALIRAEQIALARTGCARAAAAGRL